jgi:hypothetical protein
MLSETLREAFLDALEAPLQLSMLGKHIRSITTPPFVMFEVALCELLCALRRV